MTSPGKGFRWVRWIKSNGRAQQIVNNVAEEYVNLGQTDFATPQELCQVILWLGAQHMRELHRKDKYLDRVIATAFKGRLYPSRRTRPQRKDGK